MVILALCGCFFVLLCHLMSLQDSFTSLFGHVACFHWALWLSNTQKILNTHFVHRAWLRDPHIRLLPSRPVLKSIHMCSPGNICLHFQKQSHTGLIQICANHTAAACGHCLGLNNHTRQRLQLLAFSSWYLWRESLSAFGFSHCV